MHGEGTQGGSARADRVELILEELESLPTLGAVAIRLLELTADDTSDVNEVIELVSSDPALASRVLKMCRGHERGRAANVTTIDRAVLLLGFDAIRCAVLSVQVFELLDERGSLGGEQRGEQPVFDREGFWMHSLGVAIAAQRIAALGTLTSEIRPSEAFMAGLLHDIGQLVLHVLLPESFDQVCRVAETHCASLDRACRQIVGMDTHTAGKRLAEHWGLPPSLVDVIWLNGQPLQALPQVPHRGLISLVTLADALVRNRYITPGAHWARNENLGTLAAPVGVSTEQLETSIVGLHDDVSSRAEALGVRIDHEPGVLLRSICRANESLARANSGMRQRERLARRQARSIRAIKTFHDSLPGARTTPEILGRIARSVPDVLDTPVAAAIFETPEGGGWRLIRFTSGYKPIGSRILHTPPDAIALDALVRDIRSTATAAGLLPWLRNELPAGLELDPLRVLPLRPAGAGAALLLIDGAHSSETVDMTELEGLIGCWQAALTAGANHDSAAHLAEQLAEANRQIHETQEALSRSRTLATLGEVAAGAAHEMNNPLTIISGRAQLLVSRLEDPKHRSMAEEVAAESHRLSDMITALRSFAEPIVPNIRSIDLTRLVVEVVQERLPAAPQRQPQIDTIFTDVLPPVYTDPDLLAGALAELVANAVQAKGCRHIELRVQIDPLDDRLKIEVRDDGEGLGEHTLRHAFDPFFSDRPAGRQPGLGLARARRFVDAHGGQITLVNAPTGGAISTIWLRRWRSPEHETVDESTLRRSGEETAAYGVT